MNAKNNKPNSSNPVAGIPKEVLAKIMAVHDSMDNPSQSLLQKAAEPTAPTKAGLKGLAQTAVGLAKAAVPDLLGMVPVAGPILKAIATTANDDEWFDGFKGTGATFNEYLQVARNADTAAVSILPAVAEFRCVINRNLDGEDMDDDFTSNFMPSVLAHIRAKTNNVLADDTNVYTVAFRAGSALYAIYYCGLKYIKLSQHLPLNIPMLSKTMKPLRPEHLSAFRGVIEALGDYLKSTIRLPFAWTEYLRWRFGTVFYSDNTGKPGIVVYDYMDYMTLDPKGLESAISGVKGLLASAGRASADYHLAYNDHQTKFDVDDAHYDEKEFNLRVNVASGKSAESWNAYSGLPIFMDSRLHPSSALQSVLMSVDSAVAPILVTSGRIHTYVPTEFPVQWNINGVEKPAKKIYPGWYVTPWMPGHKIMASRNGGHVCVGQDDYTPNSTPGSTAWGGIVTIDALYDQSGTHNQISDPFNRRDILKGCPFKVDIDDTDERPNADDTDRAYASVAFATVLTFLAPEPLQLHMCSRIYQIGQNRFISAFLSFDMAVVSKEQIEATQRTAMRNLTRGDYKMKTPPAQKTEVKEAVAELETAALQELKT